MSPAAKKNRKGKHRWLLISVCIVAAIGLYLFYKVFGPNTDSFTDGEYLYIRTGSTYEQVKQELQTQGFVRDIKSFDLLAKQAQYPTHVHAGKYKINHGMSNYNMIRLLRSGRQTPVHLVINKVRTQQDFINLVATNLEADSTVLKQMFQDTVYLAQFGLTPTTAMCAVIPDTYDFFWNTTADKAFRKIQKNYIHFWTDERKQQAKAQGVTPIEASILASIVDEETNKNDEKPLVASVYLNRLRKNMMLQADPTVKFAVGDFTIRRITGVHLKTISPYNTYKNTGLPPGPICTPAVSSLNAVLNAPRNSYLYFCAKEDFSGYHNFATTYAEQIKNARLYQQALDARGIH